MTGSGKTEVYLRAVAGTLEAGRGAIVLVPEIALTPQTSAASRRASATSSPCCTRRSRGASATTSGSGCAPARRGSASARARPCSRRSSDIGLIVVDEEHDASYKHEGDPRYDARTVAERRARAARRGAAVRERHAAARERRTAARAAAARADRRPPAARRSRCSTCAAQHHPLHPRTRMALADVRGAGGKAIVLLNRRGWSNFLSCRVCGSVWMLPELRRRAGAPPAARSSLAVPPLRASRAGARPLRRAAARRRSPGTAPAPSGSSTSSARRARRRTLSGLPPRRRRGRRQGPSGRTLERFEAADAGLLVGTQMVAKGHDFPDVTLGVVLDADQTLRFPDFRAEERTFALVTQLAGRAGRGEGGGRVLVQTLAPTRGSISPRRAPRLGRVPRRGARAPPALALPAVRVADPDRVRSRRAGRRARGRPRSCAARSRRRARPCSVRRRCSGCAARPAASS